MCSASVLQSTKVLFNTRFLQSTILMFRTSLQWIISSVEIRLRWITCLLLSVCLLRSTTLLWSLWRSSLLQSTSICEIRVRVFCGVFFGFRYSAEYESSMEYTFFCGVQTFWETRVFVKYEFESSVKYECSAEYESSVEYEFLPSRILLWCKSYVEYEPSLEYESCIVCVFFCVRILWSASLQLSTSLLCRERLQWSRSDLWNMSFVEHESSDERESLWMTTLRFQWINSLLWSLRLLRSKSLQQGMSLLWSTSRWSTSLQQSQVLLWSTGLQLITQQNAFLYGYSVLSSTVITSLGEDGAGHLSGCVVVCPYCVV